MTRNNAENWMGIGEMQRNRSCMKKDTRTKESHYEDTKFLNLVPYPCISPLKTKRRLIYLKTQSVPRCKHFSSGL